MKGNRRPRGRHSTVKTSGYKKSMWAGQSKFLVVVRVRPINSQERRTSKDVTRILDEKVVVVLDPASDSKDILRANRAQDRRYAFDHAFGPDTTQEYVYNHSTRFLIEGVLNGFNATVFAYGATGAGKTYTMLGALDQPGLMVLTLRDLFKNIDQYTTERGLEFKVLLTYIEVYNELIRDLLTPDSDVLDLREDPIKGPTVAGVAELVCTSVEEVMTLLRRGNTRRSQEPTAANKESSRSHAVLQISVEQTERNGESKKVGKLSMVDLAGSERAAKTTNSGLRLKEGANINRSLLALGNCINALTSGGKGSYVPYRDSKLTRMLKDSLGGNCRTVMIANVSPAASCFDETLNTLKYANRAKKIKTNVSRNVLNVNYHISEYENLITGLRGEIATLKSQLARNGGVTSSTPGPSRRGERESQALGSLRNDLVENFKERMQIRRSLIDLHAQNMQNNIEIQARQALVSEYEEEQAAKAALQMDPDAEPEVDPERAAEVQQVQAEIADYMRSNKKNSMLGQQLQDRLKKNEKDSGRIRDSLHTSITSDERKELLNLEYRIGLLELDNMELEHSRLLHEQVVKQRDMRVALLQKQLALRDRVIDQMRSALEDAGLGDLIDTDALGALEQVEDIAEVPLIDFVPHRHRDEGAFVPRVGGSKMPHAASIQADDLVVVPADGESAAAVAVPPSPHHSPINMTPRSTSKDRASPIGGPRPRSMAWAGEEGHASGEAGAGAGRGPRSGPRAGAGGPSHKRGGHVSPVLVGGGGRPGFGSEEHTISLPELQPTVPQVAPSYSLPAKNPYYNGNGHNRRFAGGRDAASDGGSPAYRSPNSRHRPTPNSTTAADSRYRGSNSHTPYGAFPSKSETVHSDPYGVASGRNRRRPRRKPQMPKRPTRHQRLRKGVGRTNQRRHKSNNVPTSRVRGRNGHTNLKQAEGYAKRHKQRRRSSLGEDDGRAGNNVLNRLNARMAGRQQPAARVYPLGGVAAVAGGSSSDDETDLSVVGRKAKGKGGYNGYSREVPEASDSEASPTAHPGRSSPMEPAWRAKFNRRQPPAHVNPQDVTPSRLPFRHRSHSPSLSPDPHFSP